MNFTKFQIYTFLGSWPWCFALAWVGMKLGQAWDSSPALKKAMHAFDGVVAVALLAGAFFYIRHLIRHRGD